MSTEQIPDPPDEVEATPVYSTAGVEYCGIEDGAHVYWVRADDAGGQGWTWAALWRRYGPITWDRS